MRSLMTCGPMVFRAPENDEGADYEDEVPEGADEEAEAGDEDEESLDDEEIADQGEDDDVGEDEGEEDRPAQVARTSRGASRVAEATRIAAEAKREAAELKLKLAEIERGQTQRQQQESATQRAERLAQMDPEERTHYLLQEQEQRFQQRLNAIEFRAQDSADRTAFEGLCARSPVAAKHAAEVESELARLRGLGNNYAREVILKYIIGEKALAAQPRAKGKQERDAAARLRRETARPGRGGSDVAAESGRGGSEAQRRAKRLENMQI